jgi:ribosomal protein S18 acetylase RimI-like enzyme
MNASHPCTASVTIRPARAADVGARVAMWRQLAEQHSGYDRQRYRYADDAADSWRQYLLGLLGRTDVVVLVAADGTGHPAGFVVGKSMELPPVFAVRRGGSVQDLFVRRRYRGRGVGTRLVQTAVECLRELGAREITLRVASDNREAIAFYERLGMRAVTREMYLPLGQQGGGP